jgi:hypothetical protein
VERARADIVDRAVGCASSALVEAVETLQALMRSAEGETVRLGAARALLQFVGQRRGDPITAGIHGVTTILPRDFSVIVEKIMDAALHSMPEQHDVFLDAIHAQPPDGSVFLAEADEFWLAPSSSCPIRWRHRRTARRRRDRPPGTCLRRPARTRGTRRPARR